MATVSFCWVGAHQVNVMGHLEWCLGQSKPPGSVRHCHAYSYEGRVLAHRTEVSKDSQLTDLH